MDPYSLKSGAGALLPALLMSLPMLLSRLRGRDDAPLWRRFTQLSAVALLAALATPLLLWLASDLPGPRLDGWIALGPFTATMAILVQAVGTVIGVFSSRYLQGEAGQRRYVAALSGVLVAVHLMLIADHWVLLIAAWALVGVALQRLLCFYGDRPFALLAAHKKSLADRLADVLLIIAAALAWNEVGSGSLSELWRHLDAHGASVALQASALCVAIAVILRTALLPAHGWIIQVMEAPTPVSALLHAGVVNLGGVVLIRFSPLLDAVPAARWLLVIAGLATALLAGMVMLTRVSIKVRLAWSTVAQMGFMVLECGLGLYMFAALHLIGHSLYKAHAFLAASGVVRDTRLRRMLGEQRAALPSLLLAPLITGAVVLATAWLAGAHWPQWWTLVLALAWAPLLWLPSATERTRAALWQGAAGLVAVAGLTLAAGVAHRLPLGLNDRPDEVAGLVTLAGMTLLYGWMVVLQTRPQRLSAWRRLSYAGFYVDEFYTRLTLTLWPTRWIPPVAAGRTGDADLAPAQP
jgi:NAD(P)H-quinone oxidoreductase subunit 5